MASVEALIAQYGYAAVGGLVLAEDMGLPLPGETAVILGGAAAANGSLSPVAVAAVAAAAAIIGDNIAFLVGRYAGRPALVRWGRFVRIGEPELDRAEQFFDRWGGWGILVARFITVVRVVAGLVAGAVEMEWKRFALWQSVGAVLWAGTMTAAGFYGFSGARWAMGLFALHPALRWIVGAVVALALIVLTIRWAGRSRVPRT